MNLFYIFKATKKFYYQGVQNENWKGVLDFLKIKYEKEQDIDKLFKILKKERPDLVSGTGWFYLLEAIKSLLAFTVWRSFVTFILDSIPFGIIYKNIEEAFRTDKSKNKIREIVDSKKNNLVIFKKFEHNFI